MIRENGDEKSPRSYYASNDSNLTSMRPGQPPGRQVSQLQTHPTKDWVRRNAPLQKYDVDQNNFFFSGSQVIKSVGKDEGLTGVRCMSVVNERVWIGEREGCFSVWDFHSGERIFRSTKKKDIFVWSILGPVNGNFVWVASSDSFIRVFHAETMELIKEMKEHVGGVYCLVDTPGSRLVFSGSSDFTIVKWDGPKMERMQQFCGHRNNVRSLLVVGRRLFSGADDNSIKVWDTQNGNLQQSWEDHTGGVHALAFACGKYVWSASEDKTIRVWNPDEAEPCVRVLGHPHTGQINCLSLIGSLMWSSSWNIVFVWDPETLELKGQFKNHEGCINALLPVHQAVVSRVWSASNDGVINLWDTECTFQNAMNAVSDGRLEEAMVQLEEAQKLIETEKKKMREMEQICVQLGSEKDTIQFTMDSQKDKYEQGLRDMRRQCAEATQRVNDYKAQLEKVGDQPAAAPAKYTDVPELLGAFQLGLEPGAEMPEEWRDEPGLSPEERARRSALREAFLKGKGSGPPTGSEKPTRGRPDHDAKEAYLKAALERAYRNGDVIGAHRLREYLDAAFPQWQDSAAQPIIPISFLSEGDLSDQQRDERHSLRSTFVGGLIEGSLDKLPAQPTGTTNEQEMEDWRAQRDAYLEGKDAGHIFPREVSFSRPNRAAYARGLAANEPLPEEFKDQSYLPATTRELREGQRSAYLKARCAVMTIPPKYEDNIGLPSKDRDNRRRQREHFLAGLAAGPGATLPSEYVDSVSDLSADVQQRKELSREAFIEGQKAKSLIPSEYTDKPNMREAETERVAKLRDAFLQGLIQGELPETRDLDFGEELKNAFKKGWIAGCPFDLRSASENENVTAGVATTSEPQIDLSGSKGRSYSLSGTDAGDSDMSPEELERRKIMRDGLKYRDSLALVEKLEKECAALRRDNENLLVENKETLNDLNVLRAKIASFGNETAVRLDSNALCAKEMAVIQTIAGDNVEVMDDDDEEEDAARSSSMGLDKSLLAKRKSGVRIKGVGVIRPQDLDDEQKEKLMTVVADHRQGRKSFLQDKGLIKLGGEVVAELPALDELDEEELTNVRNMAEKYDENWESVSEGGMSLPAFDDLEDAEQLYLKEIMRKHRNADGIRAASPPNMGIGTTTKQVATSSANAVISDAVANVLDADDVPEDLRKELKNALADDTEKTTQALREVVQSSALPQVLKQQLLESVEEADKERVSVLTRAMQRATFDLKMPPDARKKLLEVLEDGKTSTESTGQYADRLADAARKAVKHQGTPETVAKYLKEALGEADQQTADMYDRVKKVTKDTVLPQEVRLQLDDALAPPSRTHHIPEAIREILQSPESVPEGLKDQLEVILDAHDARLNELSDTLAEEGFKELESTQSNRHNLPAAVHALAMHPSTTPEKQEKLMAAYNTHQGRTTAAEDAAKEALSNMDYSPEARRMLRTAVARTGISNEDMVADAVRYAVADEGVPEDVCAKLQGGLNAIEGRQGELCHVAKNVIASADSSSKAVAALKPALDACESRTAQLVATISKICDERGVSASQRMGLKHMSTDATSKYTALEEAVALVAEHSDLPEDVAQQLFADLEKHASRGVALIDSLDWGKLQGLSEESQKALRSLDKHDPSKVSSTARSVLVNPSSDLEARRALYDALVVADDASIQLRDTARTGAHDDAVPEDCRGKLKSASNNADASADALAAKVRKMLQDYGIEPAVRHSLHAALAEADSRYIALSETARSQGLQSSELDDGERKTLRNAVVAASGRSKELYHVARAAAHNTRVPSSVRQVLREALGEDMTTVVDGAMDAMRQEGVPEHHRKAIEIAITEKDMKSADLADAVRDVIENELDLSDSVVRILGDALAPVDESNALVNDAAQKANLDVEIEQETPVVIGGESKSSTSKDHVSEVRAALQSAGIRSGSRVDVYDALAEKEQKDTNLADAVKEAINKGTLPESALARLRAAIEEKDESAKEVTNAVHEAAVDPTVPLEARRLLAEHEDNVEKTAEEALSGDLPEQQRLALVTALEAVKTRDEDLKNDIDEIAIELSPTAADALKSAKTADDVRDVLDSHEVTEEVRGEVNDVLAKYHGREMELATVVDNVAHDVAVSPEVRSKMQTGHASGESIPTIQKVLRDPRVGESTKAALIEALDEAQEEEVSVVQRGKDHQMNRLKVELESKMDEMRAGFRAERRKLEDTMSENSSLRLELDEYKRLVDGLGGFPEAHRLASLSDSTKHMETLKQLREDELTRLEERIAEGGGVLADVDGLTLQSRSGDGGAAAPEASDPVEDARKRRLKAAYLTGQMATLKTPIPVEYRKYLSENVEEEESREALTNMWLKGRQDAWGSVLPAEYADAEGLTEEERLEREACRAAFLQGCNKGLSPFAEGQMQQEAFNRGRQQRETELKRAGADEEDAESDKNEVSAFDKGLGGEESQDLDAVLFDTGLTPGQCRAVSRLFGRGKWIRSDVLDPERSDSLSETLGSALDGMSDRSRLAQALDELDMWHRAASAETMKGLGFPVASPAYLRALQAALQEARETVTEVQGAVREEKSRLAAKERQIQDDHERSLKQIESERTHEVDKLKGLLNQLESDLTAKGNVHSSLHNRIERLAEQLGKSSAENELLTQELIKKASVGDVTELVTYYKERERKWNELSQLNRELQVENKTLLTESTALAQKLRALSFVFESRPTLVRSLYELHKLLSHVPTTLNSFAKDAGKRQLPRLEILDQIKGVNVEVDTCKDGTRWIIANLFTSYELQHLGTSPQFFVPDGRRPTWRDIQVPTKQRELLFATWHVETDEEGRVSPVRTRGNSPTQRRAVRQPRMRR